MLAALLAVVRKELRQTFRDRRMAAVLIVAPVLQLTLLGYAVDLDVDDVKTVVTDRDRTPTSRALCRGLTADPTLRYVGEADDPAAAVRDGRASVAVVFPPRLEADLRHGRAARVQVLVDGTDSVRAQVAANTATQYFQLQGLALLREQLRRQAALTRRPVRLPVITVEPRLYYNPQLKSPVYMVPGVVALVLIVVTTMSTAMGIARERELGTIEQLLVTPMRPMMLLLGKVLPFAAIGLVVAGAVIAVGVNLFDVPLRGSLLLLLAGTLLYLLSTLGSGVLISTLARTQQQAILGTFFFIQPAILLSGFMTPVENMPGWIQPLTWVNPVRFYLEILRTCMLKGAGVEDVLLQLGALAVFGVAIMGVATLRFRKRIS